MFLSNVIKNINDDLLINKLDWRMGRPYSNTKLLLRAYLLSRKLELPTRSSHLRLLLDNKPLATDCGLDERGMISRYSYYRFLGMMTKSDYQPLVVKLLDEIPSRTELAPNVIIRKYYEQPGYRPQVSLPKIMAYLGLSYKHKSPFPTIDEWEYAFICSNRTGYPIIDDLTEALSMAYRSDTRQEIVARCLEYKLDPNNPANESAVIEILDKVKQQYRSEYHRKMYQEISLYSRPFRDSETELWQIIADSTG